MMRLLGKIPGLLGSALALLCAATVASQATGLAWAWSSGALARDKVVRYAGILYGLDPLDLEPAQDKSEERQEPRTRDEIIADRVRNTPLLVERAATLKQTTEDLRSVTLMLRRSREKYMTARDGFESLLTQLEKETEDRSLRDLQITLEIIAPKQAKDILSEMLNAPNSDPTDNVMGDVVSVLRTLPDDKLKKVLGEFKSAEEQQLLHEILIQIGELDRPAGSNASTPANSPGGTPNAGPTNPGDTAPRTGGANTPSSVGPEAAPQGQKTSGPNAAGSGSASPSTEGPPSAAPSGTQAPSAPEVQP